MASSKRTVFLVGLLLWQLFIVGTFAAFGAVHSHGNTGSMTNASNVD